MQETVRVFFMAGSVNLSSQLSDSWLAARLTCQAVKMLDASDESEKDD